jgi:hypothetical protein
LLAGAVLLQQLLLALVPSSLRHELKSAWETISASRFPRSMSHNYHHTTIAINPSAEVGRITISSGVDDGERKA